MKLSAYPRYKPSGVDWLGDVPEHWETKAIKWESPVLRGASPRPIDDPIYFDDGGEYSWVRIADVTAAGRELESTTQRLSQLGSSLSVKLQPNELFISIAGSVGKPCITKIKCCIHDGFVFFPRWKGDKAFLFYIFASGEPYRGLGKLGTQLNLNTDTVGSIVIGLPPFPEQCVVTRFLNHKTEQIDTLVRKKEELIEKLQEKRSALIARTVTRGLPPDAAKAAGLNPHPKMKDSGIEWLGKIPADWGVIQLRRFATRIQAGSTPPTAEERFYEDGTVEWFGPGSFGEGITLTKPVKFIHQSAIDEEAARLFASGAIMIVTIGATLGKVSSLAKPASCNQQITVLEFDPQKAASRFVTYQLKCFESKLRAIAPSATLPILSQGDVGSVEITYPPLSQQIAIADYLDQATARIDRMIAKVRAAIEKLTEYRSALITAAVTGKIDVRKHSGV